MDFKLSLQSEPVSSAYPDQPLATTPDASIAEAFQLLRAQRTGAVLVCEGDQLAGVFTERDALRLMAEGADLSQPVSTVMSASVTTVGSDDSVSKAIQLMSDGGYRHLPVVDGQGNPTGVIDAAGIVHYLVDHFPDTIYTMPPATSGVPSEREGA